MFVATAKIDSFIVIPSSGIIGNVGNFTHILRFLRSHAKIVRGISFFIQTLSVYERDLLLGFVGGKNNGEKH